jgi:hypothetical protein
MAAKKNHNCSTVQDRYKYTHAVEIIWKKYQNKLMSFTVYGKQKTKNKKDES